MTGTLIVSTGRCGSTLMSDLMNLHDGVLSLSEFHTSVGGPAVFRTPDMNGAALWKALCTMAPWTKDLLRLAPVPEVLDNEATEPLGLITIPHLFRRHQAGIPSSPRDVLRAAVKAQPLAPIHDHFAPIFDTMLRIYRRRCWVERSGSSLGYVRDLLKAFPDAKLIHIYRDPHQTALSMSRHPYFRLRAVYKQVGYMPAEEALAYDLPFVEYEKFCSDMLEQGLEAIREDGRPMHSVSYEGLCKTPVYEVAAIMGFMGLPMNAEYTAAVRAIIRPETKTCPDVIVDGPCTTCGKPFDEHTHIFHGEDLCPGGEGVYTCKDCPHA